jgi:hypothetical protein
VTEGEVTTTTRAATTPATTFGVEASAPSPRVETVSSCPSCVERLLGDFCHHCGEKRPEARDLTVRHFVGETMQELTSLDSKLYHTLRALLFRPGFLTLEWIAGRRSRYLKPLNLCLAIFAIQLFVYTATKQVSTYDVGLILENERESAEQWKIKNGGAFGRLFDRAAARKGVAKENLEDSVNERWQRNVSLIQPVQILLLALLLQCVYLFSRRYFVEHLVFSMHFLAFTTLTVTLMWPIYYLIGIHPTGFNMFVALSKFLLDIFYLFVALRAVYRGSSALAVLLAFVVFAGYFVIYLFIYLFALFAAMLSVLK